MSTIPTPDGMPMPIHAAPEGPHLDEILLFSDERFVCARWQL